MLNLHAHALYVSFHGLTDRELTLRRPSVWLQTSSRDRVVLLWPDTHESKYTCTWLKQRAFNDVNRRHQAAVLQRPEQLWTAADMDGRIPRIDYAEVLTADTQDRLR